MAGEASWAYIGSSPHCEILVTGPGVAGRHARGRLEPGGRVLIEDLGTPGGTSINRPGVRISVTYLVAGDTLYLAAVPVSAKRILDALAPRPRAEDVASPLPAMPLPVAPTAPDATRLTPQRGVNIIGRDPDRAATRNHRIVVNHPMVSRNHAGLLRTDDDQYYIWDLGSAYGTFVDALRIGSSRTLVRPHQTITIGGVRFVFDSHKVMAVAGVAAAGIEIRADGIGTEVGPRWNRRLNIAGVRLAVAPRTMLALMGSSGAGKTTLLRTLAAQAPPKHGQVLFDNLDIYRQFEQVRPLIGYVPQDDVLHPQLTVRRALYFSARLRLPADYSPAEITRRVDEIMDRLGIAGQADVAIGSTEKRGISGGQRKRVSLGMELLPDPAVLFLDEPTSGLSSTDAERVIVTLRQLARDGRTVLVTIHQPSQHVYEMFDQVAVVDNDTVRTAPAPPPQPGRLIFLGPVAQCPEYFRKHDRSGRGARSVGAEAIFNVIDGNPQTKTKDWEQAFRASPQYRQFVEEPLARPRPQVAGHRKRVNLPSLWHQFSTLVQRLWWIKSAERSSMWQMLLIQPLFVGGGIWLVSGALATKHTYVGPEYIPDFLRVGKTLFFAVFTAIWLGCNNTAREIVGEFPVYRRERMVGLSLTAYLGSKVVFFAGVALIQSLILAACLFIGIKLEANPLAFVFLLWTSNLSAVALGLLLSSLATRGELAVQLVPLALLPMILFGGGVTRLSEMNSDAVRSITNVIPARWAFEGALLLENANREVTLQAVPMAAPAVPGRYTIVHHYFEGTARDGRRIWVCVAVLYFFAAVLLAACAISLRVQDTH